MGLENLKSAYNNLSKNISFREEKNQELEKIKQTSINKNQIPAFSRKINSEGYIAKSFTAIKGSPLHDAEVKKAKIPASLRKINSEGYIAKDLSAIKGSPLHDAAVQKTQRPTSLRKINSEGYKSADLLAIKGSLALDAKVKETQDLIQNRETNVKLSQLSANDITNPLLSGIDYSQRMYLGLASGNLGDNVLPYAENLIDEALKFSVDLPTGNNSTSKFLFNQAQQVVDELKLRAINEVAEAVQIPVVGRVTPFIDLGNKPGETNYIDKVSLTPAGVSESDDRIAPTKKGDFYVKIKDLRDNNFIYFRGYVTGITENVSPSFTPTNYIGRSEPVYMYERADRDISFNLKIHPANFLEQKLMYDKLEKLTSLAYPEYIEDGFTDSQTRMKPPFTELYMAHIGTRKQGQFGFIKSISYTVPGESDWDALRVLPRLFDINISYQILSKKPPHMKSNFYGA